MSSFDDYPPDMPALRPLDDTTSDQLLTGRAPVEPELALVAAFLDDMRAEANRRAPMPSPALAAVLAGGLPAEQLAPAAPVTMPRAVQRDAGPTGATRSARRPVTRWGAKLAGATLLAKAGLGFTMAAAAVTGAAAAGVPVARAVVEAVTPMEFRDGDRGGQHRSRTPDPRPPHDEHGVEGTSVRQEAGPHGETRPSSPVPTPAVPPAPATPGLDRAGRAPSAPGPSSPAPGSSPAVRTGPSTTVVGAPSGDSGATGQRPAPEPSTTPASPAEGPFTDSTGGRQETPTNTSRGTAEAQPTDAPSSTTGAAAVSGQRAPG